MQIGCDFIQKSDFINGLTYKSADLFDIAAFLTTHKGARLIDLFEAKNYDISTVNTLYDADNMAKFILWIKNNILNQKQWITFTDLLQKGFDIINRVYGDNVIDAFNALE